MVLRWRKSELQIKLENEGFTFITNQRISHFDERSNYVAISVSNGSGAEKILDENSILDYYKKFFPKHDIRIEQAYDYEAKSEDRKEMLAVYVR